MGARSRVYLDIQIGSSLAGRIEIEVGLCKHIGFERWEFSDVYSI